MIIDKHNVKVVVKYKNGQITFYNEDRSVAGVMDMNNAELKKMYFGQTGRGVLNLRVIQED